MKKFKKLQIFIFVTLTVLSVVTGVVLPGYILDRKVDSQMDLVTFAPEEYYLSSNTVMAKNASEKLSSLDKINLITGKWDSTISECDVSDAFLTEIEAVNMAVSQMEHFYTRRVYPVSLDSNYNNWFSWESKVYKYTETAFNTYTAYLWVISFSKYDSDITHTVCMTEDGIILNAETNMPLYNFKSNSIDTAYNSYAITQIFQNPNIHFQYRKALEYSSSIISICPDINLSNITYDNIYEITLTESGPEDLLFHVYQYSSNGKYGIGLIPAP